MRNSTDESSDTSNQNRDFLPLVGLILLVLYNLVFFLGKFAPAVLPAILPPAYKSIKESIGFFTLLEVLGVAALFVDTVVRFDLIGEKGIGKRRIRTLVTALLMLALLFKVFINFLDSAYLTE